MKITPWLTILLIISACGKSGTGAKNNQFLNPLRESTHQDLAVKSATYVAVLNPLNVDLVGFSSGAVTINISNDEMITNVRFNGPSPNTIHAQNIHVGGFCPNEIADTNMDGFIDVQESFPYTSKILIPLDANLNSQGEGYGIFPLSDNWGSYIYSFITSYKALMADLNAPDENPEDELEKLMPSSPLHLDERVVVIYGAPDSQVLPETVGTSGGLTANQSIPIACGQFSKVESFPGTVEPDEVNEVPNRGTNRPRTNGRTGSSDPRTNQPPRTNGSGDSEGKPARGPLCTRDKVCSWAWD